MFGIGHIRETAAAPRGARSRVAQAAPVAASIACVALAACIVASALPAAAWAEAEDVAEGAPAETADTQAPAAGQTTESPITILQIDEIAQVQTNADLRVTEQRIYDFNAIHDCVRWRFTGFNSNADVQVNAVRIVPASDAGAAAGEWTELPEVPFQNDWRDLQDETHGREMHAAISESAAAVASDDTASALVPPPIFGWAFDERNAALYVFSKNLTGRVLIEVDSTIVNAVMQFDDAAELYWDYVPQQQDAVVQNVSAVVRLPVPEGVQVQPGRTVFAWGHGAPGSVSVNEDGTIAYAVPLLEVGRYAQAHVLFPQAWLTNLTLEQRQLYTGTRQDAAIAEEAAWTDTWSSQREHGFTLDLVIVGICVAVLLASLALFLLYGRERRVQDIRLDAADQAKLAALAADGQLVRRFERWNHVAPDEQDEEGVTVRMAQAHLFDERSFKLQKRLAVAAALAAAIALLAFLSGRSWWAACFLVTAVAVAIMANYVPRRTPEGVMFDKLLTERCAADATMDAESELQEMQDEMQAEGAHEREID